MKTNYPKGSTNKFDFSAASMKKMFGMRWPAVAMAIPAAAADLFSMIYLIIKGGGMNFVFPMILFILTIGFAVVSAFTDYRFKYSVLPITLYILLSAATLVLFMYLTVSNVDVTMTTLGYIVLILSHLLLYVTTVVLVFKSNTRTGAARLAAVIGVLLTTVISAATVSFSAVFGFFGQGIGIFDEEMVLVYNYDMESDSYSVSDVLYGRGNRIEVPTSFNGKPVSSIGCEIFTKSAIKEIVITSSETLKISDLGVLDAPFSLSARIVVPPEQVDAYREQFFDYAVLTGGSEMALELCNSVDFDSEKTELVAVRFAYDKEDFNSLAKSVLAPTFFVRRGQTFSFRSEDVSKAPYFAYISPETTEELAKAYTEGGGYFLISPKLADGTPLEGSVIKETTEPIKLSYERVFLINLQDGNDEKYETPEEFKKTEALGKSFGGKFVIASELDSYISSLPTRKGFTVNYSIPGGKTYSASEITPELLASHLSGGAATLTPVWAVKAPKLLSFSADRKSYVYGDAELNLSGVAECDLKLKYVVMKESEEVSVSDSASYKIANPIPKDSGRYTLYVQVYDDSTSLSARSSELSVNVSVAKKDITLNWTLPDGETYNAQTHAISLSSNAGDAVLGDDISVKLDVSYGGSSIGGLPTDAGKYTANASFTNPKMAELYSISNPSPSFTIKKAAASIIWSSDTFEYDREAHSPTVTVTGVGGVNLETNMLSSPEKNAGRYTATFGFSQPISERNYSCTSYSKSYVINPKPIVASWDSTSFVYNAVNQHPKVSSFAGVCAGDEILTDGQVLYNGKYSNVGTGYSVTASLTNDITNYVISNPRCEFSITKKDLSITSADISFVYNAAACSDYQIGVAGLAGNDTLADVLSLSYGEAEGKSNAGTYAIKLSVKSEGAKYGNYNVILDQTERSLTIQKKSIVLGAKAVGKTYDGRVFDSASFVVSDTQNALAGNDKISDIVLTFSFGTAQTAINCGDYAIELSIVGEGEKYNNYNVTLEGATLKITKRQIKVTADNKTAVYSGATYSGGFTVTVDNLAETDVQSDVFKSFSFGDAETAINAGEHNISPTPTEYGTKYDNYYVSEYKLGTLTISKRALTVTANNKSKTYDGYTFADGFTVSFENLAAGDAQNEVVEAISYSANAMTAINAGSYKITPQAATLGIKAANYDISFVDGTLTISKKFLSVTADSKNKTYDGNVFSDFTVTVSGLAETDVIDQVIPAFSFGEAEGKASAGVYTILPAAKTTSGAKYKNYEISFASGTLNIAKRVIVISADAKAKTYDGHLFSGFTVTADNLAPTDNINEIALFSFGEAASAINAGSYSITPTVKTEGAKYGNYTVSSISSAILTVNKKALTVSAVNKTKTYDGTAFTAFEVKASGLAGTDNLAEVLSGFSYGEAEGKINAGSYAISLSAANEEEKYENYEISFSGGQLTISKRALSITVNDASKVYDGLIYGGEFTVRAAGLASGDYLSEVVSGFSYEGAESAVNVGAYPIRAVWSTEGVKYGNYSIESVPGTLTISKRSITVKAEGKTKTYDGKVFSAFSVTADNLAAGDTVSDVISELSFGEAESAYNAGTYTISPAMKTAGAKLGNYSVSYESAILKIEKRALTVSVADKTVESGAIVDFAVTATGLAEGDTLSEVIKVLSYGEAENATAIGEYGITLSAKEEGAKYKNYEISYVGGTLTVTEPRDDGAGGSDPNTSQGENT